MVKTLLNHLAKKKQPLLTFVWAESNNGVIGYKNSLPWHLPEEMAWFKYITMEDTVIMGRGTYESIPHPPLKRRRNIVLSQRSLDDNNVEWADSLESVHELIKNENQPIHIIGGASLFDQLKDQVDVLIQTKIHHDYEGDTWMTYLNWSDFEQIWCEKNETKEGIHFSKIIYLRKELNPLYLEIKENL